MVYCTERNSSNTKKLSSFTHPHVVTNLYDVIYSVEDTIRYIYIAVLDPIHFHHMDKTNSYSLLIKMKVGKY